MPEEETIGFRLDLYFSGGIKDNQLPTTANATFSLMTEGTLDKSSKQIHDSLDFYGSFIEKDVAYNYSKFTVFGTEPYFKDIFILIKDIITNASFNEKEIDLYISRHKQRLLVDLEKQGLLQSGLLQNFLGKQPPTW